MPKLIQVTEIDFDYRVGLAGLMAQHGAAPVVYEVPDNFDVNLFEGLAEYKPQAASTNNFKVTYPEVASWLENYKGTFDFYRSLQSQFRSKGMLSEKQIECVKRAIAQDKERGITVDVKPEDAKKLFTLQAGEVLLIKKGIANKIALQAGYDRGHRVMEVMDVEGETQKAYRVRVRLSARRTSHCGICGLHLENPESVARGIGPICADKVGVSYSARSLEELELKLSTTCEVTTWIPKSAIKERMAAV